MAQTNIKKQFGNNVKYYRKLRKITQFDFSEMIGKSEETISNIERGIPSTGIELIEQIAEVLDVKIEQLFNKEIIEIHSNTDIKRNTHIDEIVGKLEQKDEKFLKGLLCVLD
jgi:transcriptional regulator with XRE-family HTH domain